jgi:hypothetical protein
LSQKRNLIRCLTERAIKICSTESLQQELDFLRQLFEQNGYPTRFITRTMNSVSKVTNVHVADKKRVYLSLPFKGDPIAEVISRRIRNSVETTFLASNLCLSFSSNPLIRSHLKDKLPTSTTSYCVYSFACSCGASYVGRTSRHLSDRIREHYPSSLTRGTCGSSSSAIALHLAETAHTIDKTQAFRIIYRVPLNRSQLVRFRLLSIAEAIGIRLRNPELCVQKKFVRTLNLCWPSVNPHPHVI